MKKLEFDKTNKADNESIWPSIKPIIYFGLIVIGLFFGGLLLWSLTSKLDTAAIAPGKVTVDTNRKTIQHLEGGIIKKIHIRDGSKVKKGDTLITLDNTQARTKLDLLRGQLLQFLAIEARLRAERDHKNKITWPARLLNAKKDPVIDRIMILQQAQFVANKKTLDGQLEILNQRNKQLQKQIESLQAQVQSNTTQLKYIQRELKITAELAKKGYAEKTRVWSLAREAAKLQGNRGELLSNIAKIQQQMGETETRIITLKDKTTKETLETLREIQTKLADLLEREKSASDILKRTVIIAPQDGTVVGLQQHTVGGVISPGKPILQIVPSKDELVIEANVNPNDIDMVRPGLRAKVQLTALSQRTTPVLTGQVKHVSADSFQDDKTGKSYYKVRIMIPPKELKRLKDAVLYPGMPVQVMIISDKRSPFNYLFSPVKQSFKRAFKEQ